MSYLQLMYQQYLYGCKGLIKNAEGKYLQFGTMKAHELVGAKKEVRWLLPGGRIDVGEKYEEALVREIYEETGYTIALGSIRYLGSQLTKIKLKVNDVEYGLILGYFECALDGGYGDPVLNEEHELRRRVGMEQIIIDAELINEFEGGLDFL